MEFFDAIAQRYCHKAAFRPDPVPDAHLRQIVEAGMLAPSANNAQRCEFVIVNDPDTLRRIGEIGNSVPLCTAPAMIVLVVDHQREAKGSEYYLEDYACATTQMLLAATALGYAGGWIDGMFRDPAKRTPVCELLGIPDDRLMIVVVPVGLPAEDGPRRAKKPFAQRASWNRYAVER
ncbi:MAG: nitroreductase family protein [Anaerolineae bacterium]|nr:nitroreductase family protein [Anaerolineae bacterium]